MRSAKHLWVRNFSYQNAYQNDDETLCTSWHVLDFYAIKMDYLDEIDGLYSLVYTREAMAFKRSAVRSRLSPPKNLEIERFRGFSWFIASFDIQNLTIINKVETANMSKHCNKNPTRIRITPKSAIFRPLFPLCPFRGQLVHCVLRTSWTVVHNVISPFKLY